MMLQSITLTYNRRQRTARWSALVSQALPMPACVDLPNLVHKAREVGKVGKDGRRKFEKFLREVGELDEGKDVIDVESKQG
jgi:hypothetical protein